MPDISPQPGYLTAVGFTIATSTSVVTGVTGQKIRVYRLILNGGAAANTVWIQDGTTNLTGPLVVAAGTPLVLNNSGEPWFTLSSGGTLNISAALAAGGGVAYYRQESSPPN